MSEVPTSLILSMDYELFFGKSGSVEKCLLEPTRELLKFGAEAGCKITFFVDAGMLLKMSEYASAEPALQRELDDIRKNIESMVAHGHEVGLHVHPHWVDSRWSDGAWDFSNTRYALGEFSGDEAAEVIVTQAAVLADACGKRPTSYRAGGFCVHPFSKIGTALKKVGITTDSSVVPGLSLEDPKKGFDFRSAPDSAGWRFDDDPLVPGNWGSFVEVPISAVELPVLYYWQRLAAKVLGRSTARSFGDGHSIGISQKEVLRRLFGGRSLSELSVDASKARMLGSIAETGRTSWHVMGHPKLLANESFDQLRGFIEKYRIRDFQTVDSAAAKITV